MCWLLVDLERCRVVADLESLIRQRFCFSPRAILTLFVQGCYLPHTESIDVVRDDDSVSVKVEPVAQVNGHSSCSDTSSKSCRKRQRSTAEDELEANGVSEEWKEKKRKKCSKDSLLEDDKQSSGDKQNKKSQGKHAKKKKKKKQKKKKAEESPAPPKPTASAKKTPTSVGKPGPSNKKPPPPAAAKSHSVSSSDSSSSSKEDQAPKKSSALKPAPKEPPSTPAASKATPSTKPSQRKSRPTSSSSSETESSSDDAPSPNPPPKSKALTSTSSKSSLKDNSKSPQASSVQSTNWAHKQATGKATPPADQPPEARDSEGDEIQLVIRKPVQDPGIGLGRQPSVRGCGQGRAGRGGPRERGRGAGRGAIGRASEPSYHTDSLTNSSVVKQNEPRSAPKRDYSSMPLLAGPPQVGQKIAFKLLELAENYTPEISEYKEGKIVNFDPATRQIELALLHISEAPLEPGKFDLVYQNPDGSERVEYAVSRGAWVMESWDSLLEPRLII